MRCSRKKRTNSFRILSLLMSILLVISSFFIVFDTFLIDEVSSTPHSGETSADEVWDEAGNPHVITANFTVIAGHTLTLDPGVRVEFVEGTKIHVKGTLLVQGSTSKPITFTSIYGSPKPEELWESIEIEPSNNISIIDHAVIELANNGVYCNGSNPVISNSTFSENWNSAIYLSNADPLIHNNSITLNLGWGISVFDGSEPKIESNTISFNDYDGLYVDSNSRPQIMQNTISSNLKNGIKYMGGAGGSLDNNLISANENDGIYVYGASPEIRNNEITGNLYTGLRVSSIQSAPVIETNDISQNVKNGVACIFNAHPTISENKIFDNDQDGGDLFPAVYIDSAGPTLIKNHIYNNNAHAIYMTNVAWARTTGNVIENNYLGIYILGSSPYIAGDTISQNIHDGIYMESSTPTVTQMTINQNGDDGIQVVSSSPKIEQCTITSSGDNALQASSSTFTISNSSISSSATNDIEIADSSHISAFSTEFDDSKVTFSDSVSTLTRGWYLTIQIIDSKGDQISDAYLTVKDITGLEIYNDSAGDGLVLWIPTIEYIKDQSSTVVYTPHNISASKEGYVIYKAPEQYMDTDMEIIMIFNLDLAISTPTGFNVTSFPEGKALNITWNPVVEAELTGYILYISYDNITFDIEATLPATNTSYIDDNLMDGDWYYYKISATNSTNQSKLSETVIGVPFDTASPQPPKNLTVKREGAFDSLTLSWDPNTEEDILGYLVFRSSEPETGFKFITELGLVTQYIDSGLEEYTTYYYKIKAHDEVPNESEFSNTASNNTWDMEPPKPPEDFTIDVIPTGNALNISWRASAEGDLAYYTLYFSTDGITFQVEVILPPSPDPYHLDTNLTDGKIYYYKVTASDLRPNESPFSITLHATPTDSIPPSAPTGLAIIQDANTETLDLQWNPSPEADVMGYNVYRGLASGGTYTLIATLGPQTHFKDTNLVNGTMYYYVVSAYDEVPNNSSYSNEVNDTTYDTNPPAVPGNLTIDSLPQGNTLNISWDANSDLDLANYILYRSLNNITYNIRATIPAGVEYFEDLNLIDGATYYYRISARDEAPNESPQSEVVLGIPQDMLPPEQPQGLTVSFGPTTDSLQLNWIQNTEDDLIGYNVFRSDISGGPYSLIASLGTQIEYLDTGLESDNNYYYVISAFDEVPNNSTYSVEKGIATKDYDPPSTPENLTVEPLAFGNALNISWDLSPEPDVLIYTLFFSLDNITFFVKAVLSSSTTNYIHSDLADGRMYYYMILASDEVPNQSPLSAVVDGIPADSLAPAAPADLYITDVPNSEGSLNISWSLVINNSDGSLCDDLNFYTIYSNKTGVWLKVDDVPLSRTYYIDSTGLLDGIDYYYRITASDEVPNESPQSISGYNASIDDMSPATPNGLEVRGTVNSGELNISWDPVILNSDGTNCIDLVNYTIYRNGTTPGTWVFITNISAGVESFLDSGLENGVIYNYTIQAADEIPNISPVSSPNSGIPWDLTPPATPTNLIVKEVANAEGMLNISWDPNMEFDFSHYVIYSNKSGVWEQIGIVTTGLEYFIDSDLVDGIRYYYNISSVDFSGNEAPQSPSASGISLDDVAPSTPLGLIVSNIEFADGSLNISWDAVILNLDGTVCLDLNGYVIYSNKTGVWQLLDITPSGVEYYVDSVLSDGVAYYYKIAAFDEVPNTSPNSSEAFGISLDNMSPTSPTGLTVFPLPEGNALEITWNPNPEADVITYTLYSSTNNLTFDIEAVIPAGTHYYLDLALSDGVTYYYKIMASDEVPNDSPLSSSVMGIPSDVVAPSIPSNLTISLGSEILSAELTWDLNIESDLMGYNIFRSTDPGGPFTLVATVGKVIKYQDYGLSGDTRYYYVITAFDEVPNNSSYSSEVNIKTQDTISPAAPIGLNIVPENHGNSLNISWQANSETDISYYSIYRSSDNQTFTWISDIPTGLEFYMDTNLIDGTTYFYVLSASDEVPNQSPLSEVAKGTPWDLVAPDIPGNLAVIPGSTSDRMILYWEASTSFDVAGYNVYRSESSGGPYTLVATLGSETSFFDSGLTVDVTYYYVITAFDEVPNESLYSIEASDTTIDSIAPGVPTGLDVEVLNEGNSLRISWDEVLDSDLEYYLLYRSSDNITFLLVTVIEKGIETYVDSELEDGVTYYYLLKSRDEVPNDSDVSEIVSAIPQDSVSTSEPANLVASLGLVPSSVRLSWDSSPEEDIMGYTVYYSTTSSGPYLWYATLGLETTYFIFNLDDDTTYYFVIDSFDEVPNNSSFSNEATFTTPDRTPPEAPTGLSTTAEEGGGSVHLMWNPNLDSDLHHYSVYVGTDNRTFIWTATIPKGTHEYTYIVPQNNLKYYFVVAAFDEVPNKSPMSNIASALPTSNPPPLTPTGLDVKVSEDAVALFISWNANTESGLSHYILYRSTDNITFVPLINLTLNFTYFVDEDVEAGQTYYYKLSAVDLNLGESELTKAVEGTPQEIAAEPRKEEEQDNTLGLVILLIIIFIILFLVLLIRKRYRDGEDMVKREENEDLEGEGSDEVEEKLDEEESKEPEKDKGRELKESEEGKEEESDKENAKEGEGKEVQIEEKEGSDLESGMERKEDKQAEKVNVEKDQGDL